MTTTSWCILATVGTLIGFGIATYRTAENLGGIPLTQERLQMLNRMERL